MGYLTTHVLDVSVGKPAAGMGIQLFRLAGAERQLLADVRTNGDGRCDGPLAADTQFVVGTYELLFSAGDYFRRLGHAQGVPAFLEEVVLRFGVSDPGAHYHVPLLLSPYSYSTYRGS